MPTACVLGGTFDPVHVTHLAIARAALEILQPSQLIWLPTGTPPYRSAPVAAPAHRVAMLRLAISGEPRHVIDERELAADATGYTYDSLCAMRAETGVSPVLLMGADQYAAIGTWHRWRELAAQFRIAVVARPGWSAPAADVERIVLPPSEVSASMIRARIAAGEDVSAFVPPPVLDYIQSKGLYR